MKITIITACWNSVATIRDAMESVWRQKVGKSEKLELGVRNEGDSNIPNSSFKLPTSLEYIVVDGGSDDGTVEKIREFNEKCEMRNEKFTFRWISEKDKGMYDAINKGIRMASGDVIGILNADDVLASDLIVSQIAELFERSRLKVEVDNGGDRPFERLGSKVEVDNGGGYSLDCVYGKVRFVSGENIHCQPQPSTSTCLSTSNINLIREAKVVRRCFAKLWRPWMLQWGYMPPHPGVFIRRECFEKWGGYVGDRKEYVIAADYELLIRFFRVHKMRAVYSGLCTTVMRTGGVSTKDVGARKLLNQEIIKGNRANGYFCCWPMLIPKYAIKIWEVILPKLGILG